MEKFPRGLDAVVNYLGQCLLERSVDVRRMQVELIVVGANIHERMQA